MQSSLPIFPGRKIYRGSTWLAPVLSHPGIYASSHGRIWSIRSGKWHKLKTSPMGTNTRGSSHKYQAVTIRDHRLPKGSRRSVRVSVHSLVAEAWHGRRPEGFEVDHKDEDDQNNRPDNLCYVPPGVNNAFRHGGMSRDEDWEDVL